MKRLSCAVLCVISIVFFTVGTVLAQGNPWPQFRADAQNTGEAPFDNRGPRTGTLLWSFNVAYPMFSSPAVFYSGMVVVGDNGGYINAINADGSGYSWFKSTGGSVGSSPALHRGPVYVGSNDDNLYALNGHNGTLRWSFNVSGADIISSPTLSPDGSRIYVGDNGNFINVFNSDGSLPSPWYYGTGDDVISSPALDSDGNVYVWSQDNNVYALNSNLTFLWTYRTGHGFLSGGGSSPAVGDWSIYVGAGDNNVYALNYNGSLRWTYNTGGFITSSPAVKVVEFHPPIDPWIDIVYVMGDSGRLFRFSAGGTLLWTYMTGFSPFFQFSSPAIDSNGYVYVGAVAPGTGLHAITPSGLLAWSYHLGEVPSSPAIGADGKLYVSSMNNYLYCFQDPPKLAILKKEGVGDVNLYYYNGLVPGDWSYWDCDARNPSAYARDLWVIPTGNDAVGMTASGGSPDRLYVMKKEGAGDVNLYLYNSIAGGDWTYWDCDARNPSPVARDLWVIPTGNDAIGIARVDDMNSDGLDDLAILKKEGAGDVNLYYYNALVPGDWAYWDCLSRNPSAMARDLWLMPAGNDAIGLTDIGIGTGRGLAILKKEGAGDVNLYVYNNLVEGDWSYWDCHARNPSAMARDLWLIPTGNDAIGLTAIDADNDDKEDLAILKKEGAGDVNLYYYNALVPGDWIYWDCYGRNPSALARDLWVIPVGNDAVGMTAVRTE